MSEIEVVVAGDWHSSYSWVGKAIPSIARNAPGVKTILHVGDFGIWEGVRGRKFLDAVDFWCLRSGIRRVLVTPGNHEDWAWINREFRLHPGKAVSLSSVVEVIPRGYRFEIGSRTFASFGGAASVDFEQRTEGIDWFPDEVPTALDVARAASGGYADVLLTHETIDGGTPATESVLSRNPLSWSHEALAYSSHSREFVTQVWTSISPRLLFHGHMHTADAIKLPSGQQVISLGRDGQARNLALLELSTLNWRWLEGPPKAPWVRRTRDWETQFLTRPESAVAEFPAPAERRDTVEIRDLTEDVGHVSLQETRSELDAITVTLRGLEAALGRTLVAGIVGEKDPGVSHRGAQESGSAPLPEETTRLSFAYEQWQKVAEAEGEDVARLWFIGANPWLGGDTPVAAIREGRFTEILHAVQALIDDSFSG